MARYPVVAPRNNITPGQQGWVTWDSIREVLIELELRAKEGACLGNLEAIISELRKSKRLMHIITKRNE